MMKYTKYRITKEMNNYYIEVPFLFFFWKRLYYFHWVGIGPNSFRTKREYSFDRYCDALTFAEENRYMIFD